MSWLHWKTIRVRLADGSWEEFKHCGIDAGQDKHLWIFRDDIDGFNRDYLAMYASGEWKEVKFGDRYIRG